MEAMRTVLRFLVFSCMSWSLLAFAPSTPFSAARLSSFTSAADDVLSAGHLRATVQDMDVVSLVASQENYGLAVVCVGEAIYSFVQAPSFDHAKILIPAAVAAAVLGLVSGPMMASAASIGSGLWIATAVSIFLGLSYTARIAAPYSPSPKELAALGLLVSVAGFFSFAQNLIVNGFVQLPTLPSLPSVELPF